MPEYEVVRNSSAAMADFMRSKRHVFRRSIEPVAFLKLAGAGIAPRAIGQPGGFAYRKPDEGRSRPPAPLDSWLSRPAGGPRTSEHGASEREKLRRMSSETSARLAL